MACDWELEHRIESQDVRILMFTKQFELLGLLNSDWVARRKLELGAILRDLDMA